MHIKINNEMVDFKLEKEKKIGEVIRGLEDWIISKGGVIQSISIDQRQVDFDYESREFEQRIDGVGEISLITQSNVEFAINTLVTLGEYAQQVRRGEIYGDFIKYQDNVMEGLGLIHEGMTASLRVLKIRAFAVIGKGGKNLENTLGEINHLISVYSRKYIDKEGKAKIEQVLGDLLSLIPVVFKWAVVKNGKYFMEIDENTFKLYFKRLIEDLLSICITSSDKFESISSSLQVGDDRRALAELYFLTELFEETIELLMVIDEKQMIEEKEISENLRRLFSRVGEKLKSVEVSLKDGDMISVGDTIEYELKPLFIQLIEECKKIKDFIL